MRDAGRMAGHLETLADRPDLVLCSSAARTRQTLELVQPSLGAATVLIEPELYAATCDALLARLRSVPESVGAVLVIGHNPGLQDLAVLLAATGEQLDQLSAKFPTGALATLAVPDASWSTLHERDAELVGYVRPRDLRRSG